MQHERVEHQRMDHPRIEREHVIDGYLAGRLAPAEEQAFEEHLLECPGCLEEVRWGEDFRASLQGAAAQDVVRITVLPGVLMRALRSRAGRWAALAALGLLLLFPGWLLYRQASLEREIETVRADRQTLEARLQQLAGPRGNARLVPLAVTRGSQDETTVEVHTADEPGWLVLSVELPAVEYPRYRVTLLSETGERLWQGEDLQPSLYDSLLLTVHSDFLAPGEYRLRLEGVNAEGTASPAGQVPFLVTSPSSDP